MGRTGQHDMAALVAAAANEISPRVKLGRTIFQGTSSVRDGKQKFLDWVVTGQPARICSDTYLSSIADASPVVRRADGHLLERGPRRRKLPTA